MSFSTKWHARQISLDVISRILSPTTAVVIVPLAIMGMKFKEYGLSMYPGHWPKSFTFTYAFQQFWDLTGWTFVRWLPLTLVGDSLLRRFVWRLQS